MPSRWRDVGSAAIMAQRSDRFARFRRRVCNRAARALGLRVRRFAHSRGSLRFLRWGRVVF